MFGFAVGWGVFWLLIWLSTWILGWLWDSMDVKGVGILGTVLSVIYLISLGVGKMFGG